MLKRNWVISSALGVVIVLSVLAVFYVGWDYIALKTAQRVLERYDREADAYHSDSEIEKLCGNRPDAERIQCAIDEADARDKWDNDRRDLHAQESMEFWAKWMLYTALAGTIVGAAGLVLLWRTWVETKRTADVAREVGEAQVRAYLNIGKIEYWFEPDTQTHNLTISIINSGQSPALDVLAASTLDGTNISPLDWTRAGPNIAPPRVRIDPNDGARQVVGDIPAATSVTHPFIRRAPAGGDAVGAFGVISTKIRISYRTVFSDRELSIAAMASAVKAMTAREGSAIELKAIITERKDLSRRHD